MKDDIVSRAAVMQSLTKEYNRRRTGDGLKLAWIEKAVDEVPAVQPKDPENGSASCINPEKMHDRTMDECISRQAVLKSIDDYERLSAVSQTVRNMTSLREIVQQLPSVQPEIIVCADCKHHSHDAGYGRDWCNRISGVFPVKPDDYCSRAERRTDGSD